MQRTVRSSQRFGRPVRIMALGLTVLFQSGVCGVGAEVAQLEHERIAPEPTRGLVVPHIPGRQAIVLQEYRAGRGPDVPPAPLPPIVLQIPNEFFGDTATNHASEVWGINLPIQYPSMQFLPADKQRCWGWCDGFMLLRLNNAGSGLLRSRLKDLQYSIEYNFNLRDPLIKYELAQPLQGYTLGYNLTLLKLEPPGNVRSVFVRIDVTDQPVEYVECWNTISPSCTIIQSMPDLPQLELKYSFTADLWDQRELVRQAINSLVRSFLPP